jgi:hypothetical protein
MMAANELPFFDQIEIKRVTWLDDLFDEKGVPSAVDIAEQVAKAHFAGLLVPHPKLADLTSDDSPQEWTRQIQERLTESERTEFLEQIASVEAVNTGLAARDYSPDDLADVVSALGSSVQCIGLKRWPELKGTLIGESSGSVFIVDRERLDGGEPVYVGDEILKELITSSSDDVIVLVLTHSVGPEGTESLRRELATDLGIPSSRFGVVSKRPGGSLTIAVRAAVRMTLTQLTCSSLTIGIARAMKNSLDETKEALADLPAFTLDQAIFQNSLLEGASEIDVLARILFSRQRTKVDQHVISDFTKVHSLLARMRKLRAIEPMPPLASTDPSLLIDWRRDEVFDIGERLNALLAPLACGDVFQKDDARYYYVLLGQPCDLAVRSDGHRGNEEAFFVRLSTSAPKEGEGRYFKVPPLAGEGWWALDFRGWASVKLDCLEWTSFNKEGRVAFSPSPSSPIGLLPGWEKRYQKAGNRFKEGNQFCLSLGKVPFAVATASSTIVQFPYRRIARLRAPWAANAYAAFASFQARSAFDHDFTRGLATEKVQHSQSASKE